MANHIEQLDEDIRIVVEKTRKWAERYNRSVRKIHGDVGLAGMCGVASTKLALNLKHTDIKIYLGLNHCYNKLGRFLIDITASQFGYPDIFCLKTHTKDYNNFIREYPNYTRNRLHWKVYKRFNSARDFLIYQYANEWPLSQIYQADEDNIEL